MTRCDHCRGNLLRDYDGTVACLQCGRSPAGPVAVTVPATPTKRDRCICGGIVAPAKRKAHREGCLRYQAWARSLRENGAQGKQRDGWGRGTIALSPRDVTHIEAGRRR
jgi:hypothetical protein